MTDKTLDDVSREFARLYANSEPIRGAEDLDAAIRAAGLGYDDVSVNWLRSLNRDWVYLRSEEPFQDERFNRAYRREPPA